MTGETRFRTGWGALAALALTAALLAGCSGGGDDDSGTAATTATADASSTTADAGGSSEPDGSEPGGTEPGGGDPGSSEPDDGGSGAGPDATVDLEPREGEVALTGDATGEVEGATITIVGSEDAIRVFDAADLVVICRPMLADEEPFEETIRVTIDDIEVDADGMVDHVGGPPYNPDLLGSFGPDGSFDGGLEISYEKGSDRTCGGQFSFVAG